MANDRANAYCARREHESGFLRVEDAFGLAAKCPGMALGLELRMVAGKRVGGLPQTMLKSIVQTAESPVEMVFIVPDGTYGIDVAAPLRYRLYHLLCTTATYPPRCRSLCYTSQYLFLPVESDVLCYPNPLFPCFPVSLFPCFPVSLFPCFPVSLFPCFPVSLFLTLLRCPSPDLSSLTAGSRFYHYPSFCRPCCTCSSTCIT
eukprot:COSAG06_NODE_1921_length_8062_cov_113.020846_3_plen_203_part_00